MFFSIQIYMKYEAGLEGSGEGFSLTESRNVLWQRSSSLLLLSLYIGVAKEFSWYHLVKWQQVFGESSNVFIWGFVPYLQISSVHVERKHSRRFTFLDYSQWNVIYIYLRETAKACVMERNCGGKSHIARLPDYMCNHITHSFEIFLGKRRLCCLIIAT